jgi:transcriptional regulator with XRE-family HTH domain
LSPTELGKQTGIDPSVISRFLSGEREIRIGTVDKFFEAFGLRIVETADRPRGKRS